MSHHLQDNKQTMLPQPAPRGTSYCGLNFVLGAPPSRGTACGAGGSRSIVSWGGGNAEGIFWSAVASIEWGLIVCVDLRVEAVFLRPLIWILNRCLSEAQGSRLRGIQALIRGRERPSPPFKNRPDGRRAHTESRLRGRGTNTRQQTAGGSHDGP